MFGCHTLAVRLLAWETLCPKLGALPQIAHLAMGSSVSGNQNYYHGRSESTTPHRLRSSPAPERSPPAGPFASPPALPASGGPPPPLVAGTRPPRTPRGRD